MLGISLKHLKMQQKLSTPLGNLFHAIHAIFLLVKYFNVLHNLSRVNALFWLAVNHIPVYDECQPCENDHPKAHNIGWL